MPYKNGKAFSQNELKTIVDQKQNGDFRFISVIKSKNKKIRVKCNKCGHETEFSFDKFISPDRVHRCPNCFVKKINCKKDSETFQSEFYKIFKKEEYELLGEYKNVKTKVLVLCKNCNQIKEKSPINLLKGKGCMCKRGDKIWKNRKLTVEDVQIVLDSLSPKEYTAISRVENTHKVLIRHEKCQNIFPISLSHFKDGNRCPNCTNNKNEEIIAARLTAHNLKFNRQQKFNGLEDKRSLRFDFFLPDENIIIEYDGEQHYKVVFDGNDGLKKTKEHDKIKNRFCKVNRISLLRIPFWHRNQIPEILDSLAGLITANETVSYTKFENWRKSLELISFFEYKKE